MCQLTQLLALAVLCVLLQRRHHCNRLRLRLSVYALGAGQITIHTPWHGMAEISQLQNLEGYNSKIVLLYQFSCTASDASQMLDAESKCSSGMQTAEHCALQIVPKNAIRLPVFPAGKRQSPILAKKFPSTKAHHMTLDRRHAHLSTHNADCRDAEPSRLLFARHRCSQAPGWQ